MNLQAYLQLLLKWWWFLILGIVLGLVIGYLIQVFLFGTIRLGSIQSYAATATISIGAETTGQEQTQTELNLAESLVATYVELATRSPVTDQVVQTLGLPITPGRLAFSHVTAEQPENTQLIDITGKHPNPQTAANIANETAQQLQRISPTRPRGLVQIISLAKVPTQIDLEPFLLMILVGVATLVIAIGIILVIEFALDRPYTADWAANRLDVPILGLVKTASSTKDIAHLSTEPVWWAVMATLNRAINGTQVGVERGKSLVITSTRPRDERGKMASALARATAINGQKTILVDADIEQAQIGQWFKLEEQDGLTTLTRLDKAYLDTRKLLTTDNTVDNLSLLPAGPKGGDARVLTYNRFWQKILSDLCQEAELVVINAPVIKSAETMAIISNVDVVLEVMELGQTSAPTINETNDILERAGATILGVVLSKK